VQWHRAWGLYDLDRAKLTAAERLDDPKAARAAGAAKDGRSPAGRDDAATRAYKALRTADRWGVLGVVDVKLGLAGLEVRRQDLAAAEGRLREAIALEPDRPNLYLSLYVLLMQQNRYRDAASVLEAKLASTAPTAEDHFRMAALLLTTGRPEKAVAAYRACVSIAPRWAKARYNLGGLLRRLRRNAEAIEQLQAARDLAPDDPATDVELGLALATAGRKAEGLASLQRGARRDPGRVTPFADLIDQLRSDRAQESDPNSGR
jgi:tetratricopeptide (TPR) repeat protein